METVTFYKATYRGEPFLFTEKRIKEEVPGIRKYEIRHSDEDDDIPVEIRDNVFVNFFGTIIGLHPIKDWDVCKITDSGKLERFVLLKMNDEPEFYRDSEDDITEDEFDEEGNENRPVYFPLEGELDIDFNEEYDIPLEKVSKTLKNFEEKGKKRTYSVIVHFEGAYDCEVEATSEEKARKKAEKLFNEVDPTDVWNDIDYEVCDCCEC